MKLCFQGVVSATTYHIMHSSCFISGFGAGNTCLHNYLVNII